MNQYINPIASRLSLRPPQRESLEILARLCELLPLEKETDTAKTLAALRTDFPTVEDFERDFPSMCFALATGVGKTRLMGAFITYLHRAEGIRHFFVLAPNLTIYNKLIADFTPNTPKYVFQGIAEFAVTPPEIITGDNYESGRGVRDESREQRLPGMPADDAVHINIFNISKITSIETPKGAAKTTVPRLRRLQEYIGESYFGYLDINYEEHARLLNKLAAQVVEHLKTYLKTGDDILNVLQYHQQPLANLVHAQMEEHFEEKAAAYEAHVSKGFTTLRITNYTSSDGEERDVRAPVSDKQDIAKMVFGGFRRCLYRAQKFDSDPERRFAVILETDKEVLKWLRPSKGDFHIYYNAESSYEPDFAVETRTGMLLCKVKRSSEMTDPVVLAKAKAAMEWCKNATEHARKHGSKPWIYLLIPDSAVAENKTLKALAGAHVFHGE